MERDRTLSIAGPTIQREFGLTNVQLGYVFSALIWSYALFQAPGGRLADLFGPRRVLTFGILWWSFFTALTAVVPAGLRSVIQAIAYEGRRGQFRLWLAAAADFAAGEELSGEIRRKPLAQVLPPQLGGEPQQAAPQRPVLTKCRSERDKRRAGLRPAPTFRPCSHPPHWSLAAAASL